MRGVRRVNFRLPLFTWGEASAAGSAWRWGAVRLRAVQGQERRASARCTGAPATGRSRIGARPGTGFTRDVWRRERRADGGRCGHGHWSVLTGLEAPLLQLDEARRLEQRVEQAHVGRAARPARYKRARCHAATGHARRAPLTWPPPLRANSVVAARSRDCATRPMSGRPAAT